MFEISMGQCPIPIVIFVGVVPARKRSMETMPGGFGWMLVGSTEPLFAGLVPLVVVAPWRNLAGSVLPLPTPPEEDDVVFPWKTDGPLQEQRSALILGSRLSEPGLRLFIRRILLPARRSLWAVSSRSREGSRFAPVGAFVWGVVPIAGPTIDLDWACM